MPKIKSTYIIFTALVVSILTMTSAFAQDATSGARASVGSTSPTVPTPGQGAVSQPAPPLAPSSSSAPLPGTFSAAPGPNGSFRLLSIISVHDAEIRMNELKGAALATPTAQLLDQVSQYYEWLADLCDAHYRLATTFAKSEDTKPMSDTEKQTASKFNHLKNQALLVKAEVLVRLNRYAEAIGPLVDVVNAEPQSTAGKEAYRYLQDIGFSEIPNLTSQVPKPSVQVKH